MIIATQRLIQRLTLRRLLRLSAALAALALPGEWVGAQSSDATSETVNVLESDKASSERSGETNEDVIGIQYPNGRVELFPRAQFEELMKLHRERLLQQQQVDRDFDVARFFLSGSATDTHALLTAEITVRINRADEWISVPLGMNEADLQDVPTYDGPGEYRRGKIEPRPDGAGYVWWFRGKGDHVLTVPIQVPLRQSAPSRRLQIKAPSAVVSHLRITVPIAADLLKVTPPPAKSESVDRSRTELTFFGFDDEVDLQWQSVPRPRPAQTILESETHVRLNLTSDLPVLQADQTIRASRGTFDRVTVRLPAGFEPPAIDCDQYQSHEVDADDPQRVAIQLTGPTSGPVRLQWTLTMQPGQEELPVIEGFDVEGEPSWRETGDIEVVTAEGFRVAPQEELNVTRRNANVALQVGTVATAYRFYKQPFRLALELHEVEAHFEVEPHLLLYVLPDRIDLLAEFSIHVFRNRGTVEDIVIDWPNWKAEGWSEPTSMATDVEAVEYNTESGGIRLHLAGRRSGRFRVPLEASLAIDANGESTSFTLPAVSAPRSLPAAVVLFEADNVEVDLEHPQLRPLSPARSERIAVPATLDALRQTRWQVDSQNGGPYAATVTVHEQQVQAEAILSVSPVENNERLICRQRILYQVRYEPMERLRFLVPKQLENLTFRLQDGRSLPSTVAGSPTEDLQELEVELPEDRRRGDFEVIAEFLRPWERPGQPGEEAALTVPLIRRVAAAFSSVQFEHAGVDRFDVTLSDPVWKHEFALDGGEVWTAQEESPSEVPLQIRLADAQAASRFAVSKALIRTVFDVDGNARSRVQYLIDAAPPRISVRFPAEIVPDAFWVGERRLAFPILTQSGLGVQQCDLEFPPAEAGAPQLLTIEVHSQTGGRFGPSDRHVLVAPQLDDRAWIAQTIWEVSVPANQRLLTPPPGFSPEFHWRRSVIWWLREPNWNESELADWIGGGRAQPLAREVYSDGVGYQFSRFGPAGELELRTMSLQAVVLTGAGFAMLLGIVLLKLPATRNVVSVLVVAFLFSVAGLWFTAPLQLLLQPAILGLLLALSAVTWDGYLKRRRTPPIVAVPTPSALDLLPSTESAVAPAVPVVAGSNDPTVYRAGQAVEREPLSASSEIGTAP